MGTWVLRMADDGVGPRLAVKDCIDVAGAATTAGCPVVAEMAEPADVDAEVVASARAAGARIVGKTGLSELCWSSSGVNRWSGTPVNPLDARWLPGGSSSGSAVAVATGAADVAFGTDTGGSVRVPAACCGVTGLKTAFGRISVKGVYPLAPSLDTVGPLGADVAAVELGMRLLEPGFTVPSGPAARLAGRLMVTGFGDGVDPAVDAAVDRALAAAGITVTSLPAWDVSAAREAAGMIIDGEGFRSNAYLMPYLRQLSPHVRRNMELGARLSRADRAAAERTRAAVRDTFQSLLADFPVLVLPTIAAEPPLLGTRGFALTALTLPANLAGLPALSLPLFAHGPDFRARSGVIASMQVIGRSEEEVLAFGYLVEAAVGG